MSPVSIFIDNLSAVRGTASATSSSGQQFWVNFYQKISYMLNLIYVIWVTSHTSITGNEIADRAAKKVVGWKPSPEDNK